MSSYVVEISFFELEKRSESTDTWGKPKKIWGKLLGAVESSSKTRKFLSQGSEILSEKTLTLGLFLNIYY